MCPQWSFYAHIVRRGGGSHLCNIVLDARDVYYYLVHSSCIRQMQGGIKMIGFHSVQGIIQCIDFDWPMPGRTRRICPTSPIKEKSFFSETQLPQAARVLVLSSLAASLNAYVARLMSLQALIEEKLRAEIEPCHLEVINESHMHNAPAGAESHFKVIVVSEKFEGMS